MAITYQILLLRIRRA